MLFNKLFTLFLLSAILLSACTKTETNNFFTIQGAYFGQENSDEILLSNEKGNIQKRQILGSDGIFEFQLTDTEAKQKPFYLIYTYNRKPTSKPQAPYIKAQVEPSRDLYLPAILIFNPEFKLAKQTKNTLNFVWNKPVFSKANNSNIQILLSRPKFFKPDNKIIVAKLPYKSTSANINYKQIKGLKCQTEWLLSLPYNYQEGLKVHYVFAPIKADLCK